MRLKIEIEGKTYEVEVEVAEEATPLRYVSGGRTSGPAMPRPVAAPAAAGGRQPEDEAKACRSPLAGVVSEVKVAVGDEVEDDQAVVVLEAMKMFTTITAPMSGRIKAIDIQTGDAVKQGQLLVELE